MAVTLVGEVVNAADATTGFNQGNISNDDDFVEGSGAIGLKASTGVSEIYTTSLGVSAPYDFSATGGEFGYHIIMWFNTKTPISVTDIGLQIIVGDGTDRARWYVRGTAFYKGGFITRVIDPALAFDIIAAGTWTLGGNPDQLTAIDAMGGAFNTLTAIMGNFNNIQLDQFTIGLGVRVDGGSVGTPNTFEIVRVADEDTNFWGWWSSFAGAIIGKGKLFMGPAAGSATSVFVDTAFTVIFADERVAADFYEIDIRGAGTDVTWELGSISSAGPRWGLTIQSDVNSFTDTNTVLKVGGATVLSANTTLNGTTFIDCTSMTQNGAALNNIVVLDANTADGVAFLTCDDPENVIGCVFNFSDGHAIEITTPGTYAFDGNLFNGYGADASNDAAIYNNSGGAVTLNIINGGDTPTIRNGASASTTINNAVTLTVTCRNTAGLAVPGVRVRIEEDDGTLITQGTTNGSGIFTDSYNFTGSQAVNVIARLKGYVPNSASDTITTSGLNVPFTMLRDEAVNLP